MKEKREKAVAILPSDYETGEFLRLRRKTYFHLLVETQKKRT